MFHDRTSSEPLSMTTFNIAIRTLARVVSIAWMLGTLMIGGPSHATDPRPLLEQGDVAGAPADPGQAAASKTPQSPPDFSPFESRYPWQVSRELATGRTPGSVPETNFDEALVPKYTLPPLMRLPSTPSETDVASSGDGVPIETVAQWHQRRQELLDLFRREVFGVEPPRPDDLSFRVVDTDARAIDGRATWKRVAITVRLQGQPFTFHLKLFVPNQRETPAPVFLVLNHRDASITDPTRSETGDYWPVEYAIDRGYAIAAIDVSLEVDPDQADATTGIREFYRTHHSEAEAFTWRAISAWGWAASRAVDYFEIDDDVAEDKVAIVGHSRSGKASLWAGARDRRFALVIPNNAGDAGPSIARRRLGNTIEVMTGRNPHWFVPRYAEYAGVESSMPFDQHMLVALVAPRGYHGGDGAEDLWHDPRGAWLSLVEASKVWALHGVTRPLEDQMPLVNDLLIRGPIAYHIRSGGHGLRLYDWKLYLDHADSLFSTK